MKQLIFITSSQELCHEQHTRTPRSGTAPEVSEGSGGSWGLKTLSQPSANALHHLPQKTTFQSGSAGHRRNYSFFPLVSDCWDNNKRSSPLPTHTGGKPGPRNVSKRGKPVFSREKASWRTGIVWSYTWCSHNWLCSFTVFLKKKTG